MQVPLKDLDGEEVESVDLPSVFDEPVRSDLVRQAVTAAQANRRQDYGADEFAGMRTSGESFGSGRGMAHVPRSEGTGVRVPNTVGGRTAHPPKAETDRTRTINDKERQSAVRSAIAATTDPELVADRGHQFDAEELPIVFEDDFEDLEKTQDALAAFEAVGLGADIQRADEGRTIRAGQGKRRGRKYRRPSSVLVVTSSESGLSRAARNLAGVDVATGREVNAEDLAPGGEPGRLTVFTESGLAEVADR
ncbi:50S ribosomal protein L4 [Halodesulfurarchaeum sp.]|uniref:50S ribosomal protein L4 n=1 Tax=Halodesulfurarchaeum sp. TaxID=1980530 RepID=UPI001BC37D1F|nr:50S ribosomal protein L4 [Halodesulfurarchaeum sp.]